MIAVGFGGQLGNEGQYSFVIAPAVPGINLGKTGILGGFGTFGKGEGIALVVLGKDLGAAEGVGTKQIGGHDQ